jgi:hypothetical protein
MDTDVLPDRLLTVFIRVHLWLMFCSRPVGCGSALRVQN